MTVFLAILDPSPLYDGILMFSNNPHMTFSTNPLPHIYLKQSKINRKLIFLATIKVICRFGQTPSLI